MQHPQQQQQPVVMRDVVMANTAQAVMSTDTGVKDSVSTTCSVSAMSISSVDVELDPDVRVICRDFIRGVCGRKRRCKFQHPDQLALDALVSCNPEKKYAFCHDFQNKTCERPSCKYIHCSSEEEQTYISKNLLSLKYKCQYELGIYNLQSTFKLPDSRKGSFSKFSPYTSENENDSKRHRSHGGGGSHNSYSMPHCRSASEHEYPTIKPTQQQLLEELKKERNENEQLKERVAELQRRVADLSTMNEMLLEQNAQYRQNNRHSVVHSQNQAVNAHQVAHQVAQVQHTPQIQPMHQSVPQHIPQQVIHNIPNGHYQQSPVPPPPKYMVTPVSQQTAVITTVPQSVPGQATLMQPPVSTHATLGSLVQMRPPPGIPHQAVVQSDVSSNPRYTGNPNGMPLQIISNVPVATVQSLTVQPTPVQSTMPPLSQPGADLTQNQVTMAYQAVPPRQGAPVQNTATGHLTGPGGISINGYQDLQRISVHHQQHQ